MVCYEIATVNAREWYWLKIVQGESSGKVNRGRVNVKLRCFLNLLSDKERILQAIIGEVKIEGEK